MAFYGEDIPLDQLIPQVKELFAPKSPSNGVSPLEVPSPNGSYQTPLKGSWRSSGGFSGKHHGVDMRSAGGTAIYSIAPGVVTSVGTDPLGGNVINIMHANGVRSYYAHLSVAKVQKGDKVDDNTVIGNVGNTGNASHTFPHLHFQVWKDNQIQDPARYFTVPAYTALGPDEKTWLSDQAKSNAEAFNMQEHVANKRSAFSKNVIKINKMAEIYCQLVSDFIINS